MKQAAKGSEAAYQALQEEAGKSILAKIGIDTSQFDTDKQLLYDKIKEFTGQDFGSLDIEANLNSGKLLDEMTNIVNAAHMTQEQATSYLANMGVDAEVVEDDVASEEKKTQTGWTASLVENTKMGQVPIVQGSMFGTQISSANIPYTVFGTHYEPTSDSITDVKHTKAVALKVKSARKSSGGGFKYRNTSHGAGAASKKKSSGSKKDNSPNKPKNKIKLDKNNVDIYHDINIKLKESKNLFEDI
jgi:hypothetical protein